MLNTKLIPVQFHAQLIATNPLNCPLALTNVRITADSDDLSTEPLSEVILEPYETRIISLPITAHKAGTFTLKTVKFEFHRFFPCEQSLARKGRRLHTTKQQRIEPTYGNDSSLNVEIQQARPVISARLEGVPDVMYVGEQVTAILVIHNEGKIEFGGSQLFVNELGCIRLVKGKLPGALVTKLIPRYRIADHLNHESYIWASLPRSSLRDNTAGRICLRTNHHNIHPPGPDRCPSLTDSCEPNFLR